MKHQNELDSEFLNVKRVLESFLYQEKFLSPHFLLIKTSPLDDVSLINSDKFPKIPKLREISSIPKEFPHPR